jgi:ADP-ribosylglycohydrolase
MRCSIIGVCYGHDVERLRQLVRGATLISHSDPKAQFGALAVALAAHFASLKNLISPQAYLESLKDLFKNENDPADDFLVLIEKTIDSVLSGESAAVFAQSLGLKKGISGYIYHTVPIVIHVWLRNQDDYESAILEMVGCGGDTDTTAAIVGGIIGARVGKVGIPQLWLDNLWEFPRDIKWMEKLGCRLNLACCHNVKQAPLSISILGVLLRNFIFMVVVLLHGFRRLLPPY